MPINSFDNYPMSWAPQKYNDKMPLYKSFANQLKEAILTSKLSPNTLLPPQRELADYLDVNLSTITKAYEICKQSGYIYAATGKGTYVSPNAILHKKHSYTNFTPGINLCTIEPFHQTDSYIESAIKTITDRPNFYNCLTYDTDVLNEYRKSTGEKYLNTLNIPAVADQILLAAGSQNALTIAMLSLFHSGDKIAIDEFTYHHFKLLANFLGISLIPIVCDHEGMQPFSLDNICKRYRVQGIYLMPSCSNPSAIEMPLYRRLQLAQVIQAHNLTVIEDDSYRFSAILSIPSFSELLPKQTIYISSTSKALTSGIRMAYMFYPNAFSQAITNASKAINLHISSINAEIISELINSGAYKKIIETKKQLAFDRNNLYNEIFSTNSIGLNTYSFFRWLKVDTDFTTFCNKIDEVNIHVMDSSLFNAGTNNRNHYIRISLSSEQNLSILEKELRKIRECLI